VRAEFLPFHVPDVGEDDIRSVVGVLRSGWLTTGPKVLEFELEFAKCVGASHAIAVNSGTAALHLALDAVGLKEGDEVIVPAMTFAATSEVALYVKAKPVLVDCRPDTLNIDPDKAERAITARTKAIITAHFAGQPCEIGRILEIARNRRLRVIEDAAHALPARYKGKAIGTIGDITCFSFHATKTITTGEGGMITTESSEYVDRIRTMRLHGISQDAWKRHTANNSWYYEIIAPGYKYNMTDIAAAIGLVQLKKIKAMWEKRTLIAQQYTEAFRRMRELEVPTVMPDVEHAWHLYVLRLNAEHLKISRGQFIEELKTRNVGTSVHFIPLHLHPYYRQTFGYQPHDFPVAGREYQRVISLPLYSRMTDSDANSVIEAVHDVVATFRR